MYMLADIILEKIKVPGSLGFLPALTPTVFFYNLYFVRKVHFADDRVATILCDFLRTRFPDFR